MIIYKYIIIMCCIVAIYIKLFIVVCICDYMIVNQWGLHGMEKLSSMSISLHEKRSQRTGIPPMLKHSRYQCRNMPGKGGGESGQGKGSDRCGIAQAWR